MCEMPVSGGRDDCAKTIEQESARNPKKYFIGYQDTAHRALRTGPYRAQRSGRDAQALRLRHPLKFGLPPGSFKSTARFCALITGLRIRTPVTSSFAVQNLLPTGKRH